MEFIDPMAVKEKNKGDMMYSESRFLGHYLFEKPDFQLKKITGSIFWIRPIRNLTPLLLIGDIKE